MDVMQELPERGFPLGGSIQQQKQAFGGKRIRHRAYVVAGLRQWMHVAVEYHPLRFIDWLSKERRGRRLGRRGNHACDTKHQQRSTGAE
jgi:hypothetical protein